MAECHLHRSRSFRAKWSRTSISARSARRETEHDMRRTLMLAALFVSAGGLFTEASAMPMFARKLDVGCAYCHTTIPRLNETGYKFRAAGFRSPEDIGKDEVKNLFASPLTIRTYAFSTSKKSSGDTDSSDSEPKYLPQEPVTG